MFPPFEQILLEYWYFLYKLTEEERFPRKLRQDLYYIWLYDFCPFEQRLLEYLLFWLNLQTTAFRENGNITCIINITAWFSPFEHRLLEYLLFLPEFADEESFPRKCKQVLSLLLYDFPPFEYGLPLSDKKKTLLTKMNFLTYITSLPLMS